MAYPKTSGMSATTGTQAPILYAKKILIELYESTCMSKIANTDYEGQVQKQGDTVRIRTLPEIAVNDFVDGQELDYENLAPSYLDLLIDKGKSWAFNITDIDLKQFDYDQASAWQVHAAEQLKIAMERAIFADIYGDAHSTNQGATAGAISGSYDLGATAAPESITSANVLEYITKCGAVLSENDVPREGRWMVIPEWMAQRIKNSDLKDASLAGDSTSIMRNGRLGMIDNFTLYSSNLLKDVIDTTAVTNIPFGHSCALTFAAQITSSEQMRNPKTFGDLLRGLTVYGYKVIKPEAMGLLYAKPA